MIEGQTKWTTNNNTNSWSSSKECTTVWILYLKGLLYTDPLPSKETIDSNVYKSQLDYSMAEVTRKILELVKRNI